MSETTHLFTSITANYLPKARVLAHSAKRQGADIRFHVLLCDDYPADTERATEPFDSIIDVEELPIPDVESWLFGHTVVEMCTALPPPGYKSEAGPNAAHHTAPQTRVLPPAQLGADRVQPDLKEGR